MPKMVQTLSFSIKRAATEAASALSDLLSATTNCTFLPNTSGCNLLANLMPRSSSSPPAALSPVKGRNTPTLIVSPAALLSSFFLSPPQPVIAPIITAEANNTDNSFFIFIMSLPLFSRCPKDVQQFDVPIISCKSLTGKGCSTVTFR